MSLPFVSVKRVHDITNYQAIRDGVSDLMAPVQSSVNVPYDATIMLKVNLCLLMGPETGATVDPRVARALVEWFQLHFSVKKIIIAEADATHLSADMAFRALGWKRFFNEWNLDVEFLNLSQDEMVKVRTCYGRTIEMSKRYMNADILVSLAKLKTHSLQKITCTMKNLFGALPEKYKVKYHNRLAEAICEFSSARIPDLSFIDGLIGMDGKGPVSGIPKICELLIAGTDMVATDYFCAKLMGFRPKSVPYISKAIKLGLGNPKYNLCGDSLEKKSLDFKLMPLWEYYFRKIIKEIREKKSSKKNKYGNHICEA